MEKGASAAPDSKASTTERRLLDLTEPPLRIGCFNLQKFSPSARQDCDVSDILAQVLKRYDLLLIMEPRTSAETNIDRLIKHLNTVDRESPFDFEENESECSIHGVQEHYCFFYRTEKLSVLNVHNYGPDPFRMKSHRRSTTSQGSQSSLARKDPKLGTNSSHTQHSAQHAQSPEGGGKTTGNGGDEEVPRDQTSQQSEKDRLSPDAKSVSLSLSSQHCCISHESGLVHQHVVSRELCPGQQPVPCPHCDPRPVVRPTSTAHDAPGTAEDLGNSNEVQFIEVGLKKSVSFLDLTNTRPSVKHLKPFALSHVKEVSPFESEEEEEAETSEPQPFVPEKSIPETSCLEKSSPDTSCPKKSSPETSNPEKSCPETSNPEKSCPDTTQPVEMPPAHDQHRVHFEATQGADGQTEDDNIYRNLSRFMIEPVPTPTPTPTPTNTDTDDNLNSADKLDCPAAAQVFYSSWPSPWGSVCGKDRQLDFSHIVPVPVVDGFVELPLSSLHADCSVVESQHDSSAPYTLYLKTSDVESQHDSSAPHAPHLETGVTKNNQTGRRYFPLQNTYSNLTCSSRTSPTEQQSLASQQSAGIKVCKGAAVGRQGEEPEENGGDEKHVTTAQTADSAVKLMNGTSDAAAVFFYSDCSELCDERGAREDCAGRTVRSGQRENGVGSDRVLDRHHLNKSGLELDEAKDEGGDLDESKSKGDDLDEVKDEDGAFDEVEDERDVLDEVKDEGNDLDDGIDDERRESDSKSNEIERSIKSSGAVTVDSAGQLQNKSGDWPEESGTVSWEKDEESLCEESGTVIWEKDEESLCEESGTVIWEKDEESLCEKSGTVIWEKEDEAVCEDSCCHRALDTNQQNNPVPGHVEGGVEGEKNVNKDNINVKEMEFDKSSQDSEADDRRGSRNTSLQTGEADDTQSWQSTTTPMGKADDQPSWKSTSVLTVEADNTQSSQSATGRQESSEDTAERKARRSPSVRFVSQANIKITPNRFQQNLSILDTNSTSLPRRKICCCSIPSTTSSTNIFQTEFKVKLKGGTSDSSNLSCKGRFRQDSDRQADSQSTNQNANIVHNESLGPRTLCQIQQQLGPSDMISPAVQGQSADTCSPAVQGQSADTCSPAVHGQSADTCSPAIHGQSADMCSPAVQGQSMDSDTQGMSTQSSGSSSAKKGEALNTFLHERAESARCVDKESSRLTDRHECTVNEDLRSTDVEQRARQSDTNCSSLPGFFTCQQGETRASNTRLESVHIKASVRSCVKNSDLKTTTVRPCTDDPRIKTTHVSARRENSDSEIVRDKKCIEDCDSSTIINATDINTTADSVSEEKEQQRRRPQTGTIHDQCDDGDAEPPSPLVSLGQTTRIMDRNTNADENSPEQPRKSSAVDTALAKAFCREPFAVHFMSTTTEVGQFVMIAVHTDPSDAGKEMKAIQKLYDVTCNKWHLEDVVLAGDFVMDESSRGLAHWRAVQIKSDRRFLVSGLTRRQSSAARFCAKERNYDRMVCQHTEKQFAEHHISWAFHTREIPDECLNAFVVVGQLLNKAFLPSGVGFYRYDRVLSLTAEQTAQVSDHFPVEIQIAGIATTRWSKLVRTRAGVVIEQVQSLSSTLYDLKHLCKHSPSGSRASAHFSTAVLYEGPSKRRKEVRAIRREVTDVVQCLKEFQAAYPDILKDTTVSVAAAYVASPWMTSSALCGVRFPKVAKYDVEVNVTLQPPLVCHVSITRQLADEPPKEDLTDDEREGPH